MLLPSHTQKVCIRLLFGTEGLGDKATTKKRMTEKEGYITATPASHASQIK